MAISYSQVSVKDLHPRVQLQASTWVDMVDSKITFPFGISHAEMDPSQVHIPFPYLRYRIRVKEDEFLVIRIHEQDRFSHWKMIQISESYMPGVLFTETIFGTSS